jgi:hypothetical protein
MLNLVSDWLDLLHNLIPAVLVMQMHLFAWWGQVKVTWRAYVDAYVTTLKLCFTPQARSSVPKKGPWHAPPSNRQTKPLDLRRHRTCFSTRIDFGHY